ncbi:MAG TPA: dihydroxyacetone kinase subunit L [Propionibacteriaceae bacterium]|jgi:dihydroxyacetone kinase-like protein|nr:dihydroxyacetone kinase subunit L [Micropruina sp.]HBX82816.1 dihydroxyacetone kinase subunit L [Propionibacteriaceae bacterium]HBY21901.1 dihydroxyacetone kinase subunit L [Propionibacteriaceae bacterium]
MQVTVSAVAAWMTSFADVVHANAAYLTELDSAIGDADHGANLDRGMKAVVALDASTFDSASAYLKKAGMTLVSTVGGASGPLYGTLFMRIGAALPADGEVTPAILGDALQAGLDGIVARGKALVGDKTMVDALTPAIDAYRGAESQGVPAALAAAAKGAADGRDATIPLVARKGRASYLGERSAGHQDPGATSVTMLMESAAAMHVG